MASKESWNFVAAVARLKRMCMSMDRMSFGLASCRSARTSTPEILASSGFGWLIWVSRLTVVALRMGNDHEI